MSKHITQQAEIDRLKSAINQMDSFSQEGFERINAVAHLALLSLETPDGHYHIQSLIYAFRVIRGIACDFQGCINCEAGESGDSSSDRQLQRINAAARLHKSEKAGAA